MDLSEALDKGLKALGNGLDRSQGLRIGRAEIFLSQAEEELLGSFRAVFETLCSRYNQCDRSGRPCLPVRKLP